MDNRINLEYIDRARRGDLRAFEDIVEYNTPFVMSVCLSYMKNRHDAEDACQEVFLKVWRSLSRFRGDSMFTTYLYTVSRNTCLDMLKKQPLTEEIPETLADRENTPEDEYVEREFHTVVWECLESLDTDMKTVLLLREKADMSYSEIAEALGISEGTVKSRISRAREKLLKSLREKNIY